MRSRRVATVLALCLGSALVLLVIAAVTLPRTTWARGKLRAFVEQALNQQFAGRVQIGPITGSLTSGATVERIIITDSAGAPFLEIPRLTASWSLRDLWARRVILRDVVLERPVAVLDRLPGKRWNWDAILFPDTTSRPNPPGVDWGDWVELRNVRIINGRLTARSPYAVEAWRSATARDSLLRAAVAGELRPVVRQVPGGYQRITVLDSVSLTASTARIIVPGTRVQRYEITSGSARIAAFHPPTLALRNVRGVVEVDRDAVTWRNLEATLPGSVARLDGRYELLSGNFTLRGSAPQVTTADWRWLVPMLPDSGRGAIPALSASLSGDTLAFRLADMALAVERARLAGTLDMGYVRDAMAFRRTALRIDSLETQLVRRLLPDVTLPRTGLLARADLTIDGPITNAVIDAQARFIDRSAGVLSGRARGTVGYDGRRVVARGLRLDVGPVPVSLAGPSVAPLGGTVAGTVRVDGSADAWLRTRLALVHRVNGLESRITGPLDVRLAGREPQFDGRLTFDPLSLPAISRLAPGLAMQGNARGTVQFRGPLSQVAIDGGLVMDVGGGLRVQGTGGAPTGGTPFGDLVLTAEGLDLRRLLAAAPSTRLDGTAIVRGRGTSVETLDGSITLALGPSAVDTVALDSVGLRASARDGLLTVDTLLIRLPGVVATAHGTFGLRADRRGELALEVRVDSLQQVARFLPRADTGLVAPSVAAVQRVLRRQRADSIAMVRRTEVERLARGLPPIALRVTPPAPVRADSIAGAVRATATLSGWLRDVSGRGLVLGRGLAWNGYVADSVQLAPGITNVGTAAASASLTGAAAGLSAAGFALDSIDLSGSYAWQDRRLARGRGDIDLDVHLIEGTGVRMRGALVVDSLAYAARFDTTQLVLPASRWTNLYPWRTQWRGGRLTVDSLALETEGDARLQLDAAVDTAGASTVTLAVRNTQVRDLADLAQTTSPIDGRVSLDLYVDGQAANPRIDLIGTVRDVIYDSLPLPEFRARLNYKDRVAKTYAEVRRPGQQPNARASATIPINLALSTSEPRLSREPLTGEITLDSLPLDAIPALSPAIADVRGETTGKVTVRGTLPDQLTFEGGIRVADGRATIVPAELTLEGIAGSMRFVNDSLVVDSVRATSGEGTIALRGGVHLRPLTNPVFDLALTARRARVIDGSLGRISGFADLKLTGPYRAARLDGSLRVREGTYRLDTDRKVVEVYDTNDPSVLGAVDSTEAVARGLVVPPNAFIRGLRTSVVARIDRDVWVRNKEANVEIFTEGELQVVLDPVTGRVTLDGTVATDRGSYEFLTTRFTITRGSATFVGGDEVDPTLQAVAEVPVKVNGQDVKVRLNIGGTLLRPRLSLDSDAQPPIPQGDLISYLAIGTPIGTLLADAGSSAGGGASAGGVLVGTVGAFVNQKVSTMALGIALNSIEGNLSRLLGADVLSITPQPILSEFWRTSTYGAALIGSQIEYGRYFGTRSFLSVQVTPALFLGGDNPPVPGLRWNYRLQQGLSVEANFGPRFLLQSQTLAPSRPNAKPNFGLFLAREWRW